MGKRQTVNYFVHITHVPQLRQEHLVTVPEITVPQWRTRKVRQMEGQRRKSRAASHPFSGAFSPPPLSVIVRDNEKWNSITCHRHLSLLHCCHQAKEKCTCDFQFAVINNAKLKIPPCNKP